MEEGNKLVEELSSFIEVSKDLELYRKDWWVYLSMSGAEKGQAICAVIPKNEEELAKLLNFASSRNIGITCRGGGSSVTGSSVPRQGIVLDMSKMNRIISIDAEEMTVEVQSGAKLSELESELSKHGFTLGQFPQSFHLATVGGFISTMGTGEFSGKYGGIENSCLSLRVILADGEVIETRSADSPRSSAGPDTTHLFIGSEGGLGIILSAKLKIHRLSKHRLNLAFTFENFESAVRASRSLLMMDIQPSVCRIYDDAESAFLFSSPEPIMLLIYEFQDQDVMKLIEEKVKLFIFEKNGKVADPSLVERWLSERFRYREQLDAFSSMGLIVETAELASGWKDIFNLYSEVRNSLMRLLGISGLGAHISHIYQQGGCLYLTVLMKPDIQLYWTVWEEISSICAKLNATISHHHGVGILKSKFIQREVPMKLLNRLKSVLDPKGIMNPGKFFSAADS